MKYVREAVALGYIIIVILISGIICLWYYEWHVMETLENENRQIDSSRQRIHGIYVQMVEFSLLGETILEWENEDLESYHVRRMEVDSMLRSLKSVCQPESIDSLCRMLEDKEEQMRNIVQVLDEQEAFNKRIACQVPVVVQKSPEKPEKPKRKGFLGIFGKKEETTAPPASIQYTVNHDIVARQRAQSIRLSEHADSLAVRNGELNHQLQSLIHKMDEKIQSDLQQREADISSMREQSLIQIGGLTSFVIILLIISYIIIHRDMLQKERSRKKLEESISQNQTLLDMRKKIILTISHDIRGPLNVISGSAELAIDMRDKRKRDSYLNNARYLCRHVVHLLNNLLDVYRLNEAKETPNNIPFRLNVLLDRIAAGSAQIINDKGLLFTHSFKNVDVTVSGDEDRIEQIADNLLSNAVKFTKSGTVGISAEYSDGRLVMEISDTGMGMTEETIERIFKPFERADNVGHVEGFGLGLPITKGLVALLGGTIDVVSNVDKGTVFRVAIPLPATAGVCVADNPVREMDGELNLPFNVLVVDDDPLQCGIVSEMLERKSISCTVCTTVSDVVKAMRKRDYDILLSDINMPGTDGFALLELLRRSNIGNSRRIPVIAMTARDEDDCRSLLGHGFSACIFKPFSMQELLERISSVYVGHKPVAGMDLSVLIENVDNKTKIIQSLIDTTTSDMSALKTAVADLNRKEISGILHRIYPMWTMLRMEAELTDFSIAVKNRKTTSENIRALSVRVIKAMERLIENAKEEMETLRNEEQDFNS